MTPGRRSWRRWVAVAVAMQVTGIARAEDMKIMTGPLNSTQQRIAGEFASQVAPAANITLEVVPTAGPTDSLQRLRDESKHSADVSLAVLQADVANLYLLAAGRGNADAARWLAPLRVVAPLYSEELHFVVRSDSGFNTVQDIRDARINIGPSNGGTALSVVMLYRLLFEAPIAGDKLSRLSHEEALIKLLTDRSVDVVALLADQPAPLLANMKPEARRFIKLLKFDATQPGSASALDVYHPAALRQTSYPNLLAEDVPTLAVQLYLVAHDVQHDGNGTRMARLANAYCQALPLLKTKGLAKWREVDAGLPNLAPGWHYDKAAAFELILCSGGGKSEIPDVCLPQERALSLCN